MLGVPKSGCEGALSARRTAEKLDFVSWVLALGESLFINKKESRVYSLFCGADYSFTCLMTSKTVPSRYSMTPTILSVYSTFFGVPVNFCTLL